MHTPEPESNKENEPVELSGEDTEQKQKKKPKKPKKKKRKLTNSMDKARDTI